MQNTQVPLSVFSCPSCGAQVESSAETLSTLCAFCDTPVVKSQEVITHPIAEVVPFLINQVQASHALKHYVNGKYFLPKEIKQKTQPDEITGVFIPFWVFQAKTNSNYTAKIGINYQVTVTYTTTENGKVVTKTRTETRTDWHHLHGTHVHEYTDHLVCASRGITEQESNNIEPFDLGKALRYDIKLLSGKLSEMPIIEQEEAMSTATQEITTDEGHNIQRFLTGDTHSDLRYSTQVSIDQGKTYACLLPVWIATYKHKDSVIRLLVNGQTSKVGGYIPKDTGKIVLLVLFIIVLLGAVAIGAQQ